MTDAERDAYDDMGGAPAPVRYLTVEEVRRLEGQAPIAPGCVERLERCLEDLRARLGMPQPTRGANA